MDKRERNFVFFLLLLILILSCFLIYKIKTEPKYDEKMYNEIYAEYEELFETNKDELKEDNNLNNNKKELKEDNSLSNNEKDNTINLRIDAHGNEYRIVGEITIPKIKIQYPIIYETSENYLKIAPTKLFGPDVNEVGNLCIVGHNYKNKQFFSRLSELDIGDEVYLKANNGKGMIYLVYDKYEIAEDDMQCTSQETNGNIELTLITCTTKKKNRLVVKCKAIT